MQLKKVNRNEKYNQARNMNDRDIIAYNVNCIGNEIQRK